MNNCLSDLWKGHS